MAGGAANLCRLRSGEHCPFRLRTDFLHILCTVFIENCLNIWYNLSIEQETWIQKRVEIEEVLYEKVLSFFLVLTFVFSMSTTAFASERSMTVEEATEYLENYYVTKENSAGETYTTQYIFSSEEDLNNAALYIAENGLAAFNAALDTAIEEAVSNEPPTAPRPFTTTPTTAYATVSGNGTHYVSAEAYGLANFDTLGTVEYLVELGYRVTLTDGTLSNVTSISFDIPYISAAGSWGDTSFPSYASGSHAGVTANYTITKSLEIGIDDFSFVIKSETDFEIFALLTSAE